MTKSMQLLFAVTFSTALAMAAASAQVPADGAARNLSLEQQTKIADVITRDAGPPVAAGHFSIAVGNTVPADVPIRPVPASVAAAAPQLGAASYVVVEEQIALVDSRTRKILAVVQRGLRQSPGSAQTR
jgi:hypothetical protein